MAATIADITAYLDASYPPGNAADWDAVGVVCGRGRRDVDTVFFAVDCVPETVTEAREAGAALMVTHHPLLLRGVTSLATGFYKGEIVHTLIEAGMGLYVAHTNADVANPGVSDALAYLLDLEDLRPLSPMESPHLGIGRVGTLPAPMRLDAFTSVVAERLPATAWGVRAAGNPAAMVRTVAVSGGAGDSYLDQAAAAGADAYLTADLRHHPASEATIGDGLALLDAAHWATERPWLDLVAANVRDVFDVATVVSDLNTDPWTLHASSPGHR